MKVRIKVKGTQVKLPVKERKNEHAKRRADNSLRPHISRPCCDPRTEYDRSRIFDIRPKPKFSFKKIRPSAEGISRSRRYKISLSSPNSEVECIKYDVLDFCNNLLLTANFPFENNRVLLW